MKHLLILTALLTTPAYADFHLSRTFMNFGSVRKNFSQTLSSTLTNTGTETIRVQSSQACADFSVSGYCGTLLPGQSCTIYVRYRPYREGYDSCTIRFRDSTGHSDSISARGRCIERFQEE